MRLRLRRTPGHHWKLMTATILSFTLTGFLLMMTEHLLAGFAFILGTTTLALQWFCIDPPYVDDEDLHGTAAKTDALGAQPASKSSSEQPLTDHQATARKT